MVGHDASMSESNNRGLSVSVVIPTYNRAHLIRRALASVVSQTRPQDEIIVVDDGSTDNTAEVVADFGAGVQFVRIPKRGAGAARNEGIRRARGDLVAFLDSDDEWLPGKLDLQRAFLQARPDVLFCAADFSIETGGQLQHKGLSTWCKEGLDWEKRIGPGELFSSIASLPAGWPDFRVYIGDFSLFCLEAFCASIITVVVRRKEAGEALHFAEDVATHEDWECLGRLARRGVGAHFDWECAINHGHEGPRLTGADLLSRTQARLLIANRVWGDEAFQAQHGLAYRRVLREQQLLRLKALLLGGQFLRARSEVKSLDCLPLRYRIMPHLPVRFLAASLSVRRFLYGHH